MNKKKPTPTAPPPIALKPSGLFNFSFNIKCIILAAIAFGFYINTVNNQYALDDTLVITGNNYVQQGFSGVKKILTTDTYDSFNKYMHADNSQQLSGGRYRPLSVVIFAIEHQLLGESPATRHFISVLAFMLCVLSIFYFLTFYLFKKIYFGEDIAFIATLLFAIHPLHTEVVANVKSLDEILSLTFIILTFIFSLKYIETKKTGHLIIGTVSLLLALLAKEYAIALIFLVPLLFYLRSNENPIESLRKAIPYFGIAALYLLIRFSAVGIPHSLKNDKILTNPYLYATPIQKIATEIFVLGKYMGLLFFPYPLSADYSYAQIAYHNFSNLSVWASILIYVGLAVWGVMLTLKKNILAFPVFFFLANIALVSNIGLDIGATMGERLVFHSSLGFATLISFGLFKLIDKLTLSQKKMIITPIAIALIVLCGAETLKRNAQWKNDTTLFIADAKTVPNSFMANGNAGAGYIRLSLDSNNAAHKKELIDTAIFYLKRSLIFFKAYDVSYYNLGACYLNLGNIDLAKAYWDSAKMINANYPPLQSTGPMLGKAFLAKGLQYHAEGKLREALHELKLGLFSDNTNVDLWDNIGGAYYTLGRFDSARYAWKATLQLNPKQEDAKKGLGALPPQGKDTVKGIR
ncbi:MAG TPA: glycosyltransferase family 39 protein [Bacteroidia bacterium]|jgi:tetratricopeptide (TPR) repeat protein|nr:glycosyltransferase family 39 protein [Bacteroidia bacterium]